MRARMWMVAGLMVAMTGSPAMAEPVVAAGPRAAASAPGAVTTTSAVPGFLVLAQTPDASGAPVEVRAVATAAAGQPLSRAQLAAAVKAGTVRAFAKGRTTVSGLPAGTVWRVVRSAGDRSKSAPTVRVVGDVGTPTAASGYLGLGTGMVQVTWSHRRTWANGANPTAATIAYKVSAEPADGEGVSVQAQVAPIGYGHSTKVLLRGLDETESAYLVHLQAVNPVDTSTIATFTTDRPLADIRAAATGAAPDLGLRPLVSKTDAPVPTAKPTTTPGARPSGSGGSSSVVAVPPPTGGRERLPLPYPYTTEHTPYTFHSEAMPYTFTTETTPYTYSVTTEHTAYTYHDVFVQTGPTYFTDLGRHWDGSCTGHGTNYLPMGCGYFTTPGYNQPTKDATPNGWTDTGSDWTRQVVTKNAAPAGWTDDGSQWTRPVKDATPAGWSDDGVRWVRQVKDATPSGWDDDGTQWTRLVNGPCPTGYVDDGRQCIPA